MILIPTDKIVNQSKSVAATIIEVVGPGSLTRSILKNNLAIVYAIDKDMQSEKMLTDLKWFIKKDLK